MRTLSRFALVAALGAPALARADDPTFVMTHMGRLLDGQDQPVTSPSVSFAFRLYDVDAPNSFEEPLWQSGTCTTVVNGGNYSVVLGGKCGSGLTARLLPPDKVRFLEVSVNGAALLPRLRIGTVPSAAYALSAGRAQTAADSERVGGRSAEELDARYARLQTQAPAPQAGALHLTGSVTAQAFVGDGAGLTNLDAAHLTGTLDPTQLPASASFAGTVTAGIVGGKHVGDGAGLTGLDAGALSAGILPSARLGGSYTNALNLAHPGNQLAGTFSGTIVDSALGGRILLPRNDGTPYVCGANTAGGIYFDGGSNKLQLCDGAAWRSIGSRPAKLLWTTGGLEFGDGVTSSLSRTATLLNLGDEPASGIGISASTGFSIDNDGCNGTLAAASVCSVTVSVLQSNSQRTGTLTATFAGNTLPLPLNAPSVIGNNQANPGLSCRSIKTVRPAAADGAYWIDPNNNGTTADAFQVFCDMTTDGGGWTLAVNRYVGADSSGQPDLNTARGNPLDRSQSFNVRIDELYLASSQLVFAVRQADGCTNCRINQYDSAVRVDRPSSSGYSRACSSSVATNATKLVGPSAGTTGTAYLCANSLGWGSCNGNVCHYGVHDRNTTSDGTWSYNQWQELHFPSAYSSYASQTTCRACSGGMSGYCCSSNDLQSRHTIWLR